MNKIITGFLGILMVAGVVGGTAYALFSATATVNGINITTGSAGLEVNGETTLDANLDLNNLYPGYQDSTTITVENTSTSPIALTITGQLTAAGGSWNALKDVIQVRVVGTGNTGWRTLAEWNANPINLPDGALAQNDDRTYTVQVRIPSGAGNEIANLSLTNVTFTLVGTQAP